MSCDTLIVETEVASLVEVTTANPTLVVSTTTAAVNVTSTTATTLDVDCDGAATVLEVEGQRGQQGEPGTGGAVSILAAENLAAYVAVTGSGVRANSGTTLQIGKVVGITTEAILTGFRGDAATGGSVVNPAWSWNINDTIFLNGNTLSTTPPAVGFIQPIGVATGTDTISIEIQTPILL